VQFRRLLSWFLTLLALLIIYLFFWPVEVTPIEWTPQVAPALSGVYKQNSKLATTERIYIGDGDKPEDVAIDSSGRIYAGFEDGRIHRANLDGKNKELFANTNGRPLGLAFDASGNLIVADAIKGLLSINSSGQITVLTTEANGVAFRCTNDLDIARDGTIYFTDASRKFPLTKFKEDLIESQPNGRLLSFDPKTKKTTLVLDNLCFANGVAISPDQSFLLINETGRYRIHRVWLSGTKRGHAEVFVENLPGFPDGISSNGKDKFWLAVVTPRDAILDKLLPYPFLRKVVLRLPAFLQPAPKRYSFVLAFDVNGKVIENLQNPAKDCYAEIANVVEHDGALYFGSIGESTVGRFRLSRYYE
jgi:strictosidine synthase-like protein